MWIKGLGDCGIWRLQNWGTREIDGMGIREWGIGGLGDLRFGVGGPGPKSRGHERC